MRAATALVLAAHEARVGEVPEANALVRRAIDTARAADAPRVVAAGRALSKALSDRGVVQAAARTTDRTSTLGPTLHQRCRRTGSGSCSSLWRR